MAKKAKHEAEENAERWLLTYSDMITLLLAFFVIMYSMSKLDQGKYLTVAQSMSRAFGNGGVITGLGGLGGTDDAPAPIFLKELPQQQQDFFSVGASMAEFAESVGLTGDISVNMTYEGVVISLSEALIFEPGNAKLTEQAKTTLQTVAEVLRNLKHQVRVSAHTDNVPTGGEVYATNWELSAARAVTIVRYLTEQCGVDPSLLSAEGNSEYKPLITNDTSEHRAINRRAEIVILYPVDNQQYSMAPLMSQPMQPTPVSSE